MRAYYCITPPRHVVETLSKMQNVLRGAFSDLGLLEPVSWQRDTAFHVTVLYIGEIPAAKEPFIRSYAAALEFEPFTVSASALGVFKTSAAHVLHLQITKGRNALVSLHNTAEVALKEENALDPARYVYQAYTPHVTLARSPLIQPFSKVLTELTDALSPQLPLVWKVDKLTAITAKKEGS